MLCVGRCLIVCHMNKTDKPRKSDRVTFRLTPREMRKLERAAKWEGVKVSALVRKALDSVLRVA